MKKYIINFVVLACFGLVEATNSHVLDEEQQNDLMRQVMQIIWEEAMEAKEATRKAIKIALGSLFGFLGGTVLKFVVSIYITVLVINQMFTIFQ